MISSTHRGAVLRNTSSLKDQGDEGRSEDRERKAGGEDGDGGAK